MNPAELHARSNRRRTWAEVEREINTGCVALGGLAVAAQITGQPLDRQTLRNTLEGLRLLLAEAEGAPHGNP